MRANGSINNASDSALSRCTAYMYSTDGPPTAKRSQQVVHRGFDGQLKMGILPVSTFCSGHTFFVQRMADSLGLKPYVVHATFQFSGTPGKRHRMRESLLWTAVRTTPPPPPPPPPARPQKRWLCTS